MDGDHITMCKFCSRDDHNYELVLGRFLAELMNLSDPEKEAEQKELAERRLIEWVPQHEPVPWVAQETQSNFSNA